jgi:DNA repair protein RadD
MQLITDLWPHQARTLAEIGIAMEQGKKIILVTTPTGGGKTRSICETITHFGHFGWPAVVYTNRKMLIDQLSDRLDAANITHGVRAAGHEQDLDAQVQLSSLMTEAKRTLPAESRWSIHGDAVEDALAIIDEAHLNSGDTAHEIIKRHVARGHRVIGFTATPLDLGRLYETLLVCGTNSELRACGALVRADVYGPDEPDLKRFKKEIEEEGKDPGGKGVLMAMGGQARLFGRVLEWFHKLNKSRRPSILFAPGVPESLWFAQQFTRQGIPAAHIDGNSVWFDGESRGSTTESRAEILARSRDGELPIICNRFVMREGIDAPWLEHGILATIFGSLSTYLQSVGRLLRASPGKERCTIQDHGGNWHVHGSPNSDRHWDLDYTPGVVAAMRTDALREKLEKEPSRCPGCSQILFARTCPTCGRVINHAKKVRPVVTSDGELVAMRGDVYRRRFRKLEPDTEAKWKGVYFRARNSQNMTFRMAEGLFFRDHGYFPPRYLPFMPRNHHDFFRLVRDVPPERLR